MKTTFWTVAAMAAIVAAPAAQDPGADAIRYRMAALADTLSQAALPRTTVESRITKGAPYSGEAVTESLQILSDGTRISRRTVTRVFRDTEGRTRREMMAADGSEPESINISDPVAEASYVLNPKTKTAFRNGVVIATPRGGSVGATVAPGTTGVITTTRSPDGQVKVEARQADPAKGEKGDQAGATAAAGGFGARGGGGGAGGARGGGGGGGRGGAITPATVGATATEDLGQQTVEGLVANGTRTITTIPVGAIGNDQPIRVVSEQWFSPDLQVLVMTKHNDPRTGETIFRLSNIVRAEPDRSLFQVPADYTFRDSIIRREMK